MLLARQNRPRPERLGSQIGLELLTQVSDGDGGLDFIPQDQNSVLTENGGPAPNQSKMQVVFISSAAFNRPEPWSAGRIAEVAVPEGALAELDLSIDRAVAADPEMFEGGFVAGGRASLQIALAETR